MFYHENKVIDTLESVVTEAKDLLIIKLFLALKTTFSTNTVSDNDGLLKLNLFNVTFDFPETVVCRNLSLADFGTPLDIMKEINNKYHLPITSQTLFQNGTELTNTCDCILMLARKSWSVI